MKKLVLTLIILFTVGTLYAGNFLTGLQQYEGKKIYVYYLNQNQMTHVNGILLAIYSDGVKIKDGRDIYFINNRYINYILFQEKK